LRTLFKRRIGTTATVTKVYDKLIDIIRGNFVRDKDGVQQNGSTTALTLHLNLESSAALFCSGSLKNFCPSIGNVAAGDGVLCKKKIAKLSRQLAICDAL
jgi:hypothetical protein